ncbi:hypothetical protein B0H15DRAFT_944155 [Mycena belliarum]|uniref:Transmembrane protein n=1 Tax=Mycena belliarum TaxID=1033014 RepID=A0AAD6ULM8_9AGAR|nr:hypothetical protein B0H15DRAFT_944155 [Mycena belliae]
MSSPFSIIDDRDEQSVSYIGTWVVGGTYEGSTSSLTVGDSLEVSFTGTRISVYGTLDATSAGVQTAYAIDNSSPANVTAPESSYGVDSTSMEKQLFWQSDALPNKTHTLTVTMNKVNGVPGGDGEGTVWFDYFNVTGAGPTSTGRPRVSGKKSNLPGIIAAIVVVTLAILCGLLFLLLRRPRRKKRDSCKFPIEADPTIEPFITSIPAPSTPTPSGVPVALPLLGGHPANIAPSRSARPRPPSGPRVSSSSSSRREFATIAPTASIIEPEGRRREGVSTGSYEQRPRGAAAPAPPAIRHADSVRQVDPGDSTSTGDSPPVYTLK